MKNIKSILLFICLSVIILLISLSIAGERPLSIIYAGEGIGNIRLGYRMEDVIKNLMWGKPEEFKKDEQKGEYYLIYKSRGVNFIFKISDKAIGKSILQKVIISSPVFITADIGIRVGDKGVDIKKSIPSQQALTLQNNMGGCMDNKEKDKRVVACEGIGFIINKESDVIEAIEISPLPQNSNIN